MKVKHGSAVRKKKMYAPLHIRGLGYRSSMLLT